jgi:transposase
MGCSCDSGLSFRPGRSARSVEAVAWNGKKLRTVWVDGTYCGAEWMSWVKDKYRIVLTPVLRTEKQKGFSVLPRRWVVERTLAWLNQFRRLSKDYEELPTPSETFIYMAMTRLMLRRLAA